MSPDQLARPPKALRVFQRENVPLVPASSFLTSQHMMRLP